MTNYNTVETKQLGYKLHAVQYVLFKSINLSLY